MQSQNRFFDDLVKVLNGAAGTMAGMGREAEGAFRDRARDWVGGLDMISRDEFEAVKAIAVAAREENQLLKARIERLEAGSAPAAATPVSGTKASAGSATPKARKKPGAASGTIE
ncbi:MAG: accessory factor UbiK family protein [Sphingosinicella sp.]|nr:accessory factor UbiK family protein [Sphingosinicella sp.]